jgi:hypothetical protein
MPHEQVWAKVNAHVDKGIAPLVSALSMFPELRTLSSCEGYDEKPASVSFKYGPDSPESWRELAAFVFGFFGPELMAKVGDYAHLSVEVSTWGEARGDLHIRPGCIQDVAKAVAEIATTYRASNSVGFAGHTTECSRDMACTLQSETEAHTERPAESDVHPSSRPQAA